MNSGVGGCRAWGVPLAWEGGAGQRRRARRPRSERGALGLVLCPGERGAEGLAAASWPGAAGPASAAYTAASAALLGRNLPFGEERGSSAPQRAGPWAAMYLVLFSVSNNINVFDSAVTLVEPGENVTRDRYKS